MREKSNSTTKKESPKKPRKTLEQLITELTERDSKVREFSKEDKEFFIREALENYNS